VTAKFIRFTSGSASVSARLFLILVGAALTACPPKIDTGEGAISVGSEGGVFVRNGAGIEIPKGALPSGVTITVTMVNTGIPEVPGRKRISPGFRFSPSSITFTSPIKIFLPFIEAEVPAGVQSSAFDMRRQSGAEAYLALTGSPSVLDPRLYEGQTDRLGLFWVTSPTEPAVGKISLEPPEVVLRVNDTQQYTFTATDELGNTLTLAPTWAVAPARVATIDANGLLTAKAPGSATITASVAGLTETATVRVQGSAVGPTTFLHENPFPTGNDLHGGALAGGGQIFVGDNATVLTRDAAGTFTRRFSSSGVTLKAVGGTALDNLVAVGVVGTNGVLIEVAPSGQPKVTVHPTALPRALWYDGTHGMAVGSGNHVLIRRNGAWEKEFNPSQEELLAVLGDGAGAYVTVTNQGSIYRFNPATKVWDSLFITRLSVRLDGALISDPAGAEVWAAGGNKLWRFSANAWTAINLPASPVLSALTAVGKIDGRLVVGGRAGRQGHVLLYEPVGATWVSFPLRERQQLLGVLTDGAGGFLMGSFGAVWQYAGSSAFTELSRGFYGDVADVSVAADTVAAAINDCTTDACTAKSGKIVQRTGPFQWKVLGAPFGLPVTAVLAVSATDITAAVAGDLVASPTPVSPSLRHWDGLQWTTQNMPNEIFDLQACKDAIWAVGANGAVYSGTTSTSLTQQPVFSGDLYSVHCAEGSVWAAGDFTLLEKVGNGNFQGRTTPELPHPSWRAVYSPGVGEGFAFGNVRYGVYWDTTTLQLIDVPGNVLAEAYRGMWGSSIDNLYAVGNALTPQIFGLAVRHDGASWRAVDAGSQRKATSINGISNTEIWIGTEGGGILRGVPPATQ
jgi:hypothetical protein